MPSPQTEVETLSIRTPSPLSCPAPEILERISDEEARWVTFVLENIEAGITTHDEVIQLLGESEAEESWVNEYWPDDAWTVYIEPSRGEIVIRIYFEDEIVQGVHGGEMTLGQLVDAFGEPSIVYWDIYPGNYNGPVEPQRTLLYYEEQAMGAGISQGLCEFPSQLVMGISVESPDSHLDDLLTDFAVEMEWPGITTDFREWGERLLEEPLWRHSVYEEVWPAPGAIVSLSSEEGWGSGTDSESQNICVQIQVSELLESADDWQQFEREARMWLDDQEIPGAPIHRNTSTEIITASNGGRGPAHDTLCWEVDIGPEIHVVDFVIWPSSRMPASIPYSWAFEAVP